MIHYHGTPFSGDNRVAIRALEGKHAMVSFADPKQLEIVAEVCQTFTFDNGAFTAWKQGKDFNIDAYADWVNDWCHHPGFDWYIIPDVIDGSSSENMAMIARWRELVDYKVFAMGVPVWHMHEDIEVLAELCHAYRRVALGSSGDYAVVGNKKWWTRMADAMGVATDDQGRPKAKLHGLRMLDPTVFSHLPLASADSTNVARNIGICQKWKGTYQPKTKEVRAAILMERIEAHCSASRWCKDSAGIQHNGELFG